MRWKWAVSPPLCSALGLTFSGQDGLFALVGAASTTLLAIGFARWRQRGESPITASPPVTHSAGICQLLIGSLALLVIAVSGSRESRGYPSHLGQRSRRFRVLYRVVVVVLLAAFYQTAVFVSSPANAIVHAHESSVSIPQVQVIWPVHRSHEPNALISVGDRAEWLLRSAFR